jgi:hypothetical protein
VERVGLCDGINRLYMQNRITFDEHQGMSTAVFTGLQWWSVAALLRCDFGCHRWRRTRGGYRARIRFCERMAERARR